jgi:DNA polymerase-3 subunit delta'
VSFTKTAALDLLRRANEQQRLAHAYLICGPQGSGKREVVAGLAAMVTDAPGGKGRASSGGKPAGDVLNHPDIHIAEPESKSRRIVIEQVREMEKELQMRSMLGGKKVGVLFDADRLKVEASNAFLKTLEEPPNNSLLLLTTTQPEALPDTILSRCIVVTLSAGDKREPTALEAKLLHALREFFSRETKGIAPALGLVRDFSQLLADAKQALTGELDARQESEEARYKQTTDGEWLKDREEHFKALAESRYVQERFALVAVLLNWWADVLRHQNRSDNLEYPAFATDTAKLAEKFTTAQVLKKITAIENLRENLDRNIQEVLALEVAFLKAFAST